MTVTVAMVAVLVFVLAFRRSGIVSVAQHALQVTSHSTRVVMSRDLDDEIKEQEARKAAVDLLSSALSICWRTVLVLLASVAPIYGADAVGLVDAGAVISLLSRWDVIVVVSVVMVIAYVLIQRVWPTA